MIAAGEDRTLGLQSDGRVLWTGWDFDEDGYYDADVTSWSNITAVAAGLNHTVGLKSDGTVEAELLGSDSYGQIAVGGWGNITAIAAGGNHTVGLKADGTVLAVGSNTYGQKNVSAWTNITAIAAGSGHTVGLKSNGDVVAVGLDNYDQVWDAKGWNLNIPVTTIAVSGATANAAGWYREAPTVTLSTDVGALTYYRWNLLGSTRSVAVNGQPTVPQGRNTLYYWSQGAAQNTELAKTQEFKLDYTAPRAPVLSGENTGSGMATLSWTAWSDPYFSSGFSVYALYKGDSFVTNTTAKTYQASGLVGGEIYTVRAVDSAGNEAISNAKVVGPFPLEQRPTAPGVTEGEVTLVFDSTWTAGTPTVAEAPLPETRPSGDPTPVPGAYYDISTTAAFNDSVKVKLSYSDVGLSAAEEASIKIYHYSGGQWSNITDENQPDTVANTVTGTTTSFSGFGVFYTEDAEGGAGGGTEGDEDAPVVSTPASSDWSLALVGLAGLGVALVSRRRLQKVAG